MNYAQWREKYVEGKKTAEAEKVNMEIHKDSKFTPVESELESEKKARKNKETSVNWDAVNFAEYRKKFDGITGDKEVDSLIHQKALDILSHRNNTYFEDMYLIDTKSKKVVASQTHSILSQSVDYNEELTNATSKYPSHSLISIHNHPLSSPPSGSDIYSNAQRKYLKGVIPCHNGDVYVYSCKNKDLTHIKFDKNIDKWRGRGYNIIESFKKVCDEYSVKWRLL